MNIGLYGGTFSPPHKGHVRAATLFVREAALDKLYVMPAGIPPHKQVDEWARPEYRLEMSRLAFSSFAEVSDHEIKKEGRSYTVETLRYLRESHPQDSLYMLVGEDMFLTLDTWKCPDEIMSLCTVVAMRRSKTPRSVMEEAAKSYESRYRAKIILIDEQPYEASSTEIRKKVANGENAEEFLPPFVAEYIYKNGLYRNDN